MFLFAKLWIGMASLPQQCFQGGLGTSLCLSQWVRPQQFLLVKVDDEDSGEEDEVEVSEPKKPKLTQTRQNRQIWKVPTKNATIWWKACKNRKLRLLPVRMRRKRTSMSLRWMSWSACMWEHQLARSLMKMIWQSAPLQQLKNVQGEFLHLAQFHGVASHWQVCLTSPTFSLIFRARSCFHTFGSSSSTWGLETAAAMQSSFVAIRTHARCLELWTGTNGPNTSAKFWMITMVHVETASAEVRLGRRYLKAPSKNCWARTIPASLLLRQAKLFYSFLLSGQQNGGSVWSWRHGQATSKRRSHATCPSTSPSSRQRAWLFLNLLQEKPKELSMPMLRVLLWIAPPSALHAFFPMSLQRLRLTSLRLRWQPVHWRLSRWHTL